MVVVAALAASADGCAPGITDEQSQSGSGKGQPRCCAAKLFALTGNISNKRPNLLHRVTLDWPFAEVAHWPFHGSFRMRTGRFAC